MYKENSYQISDFSPYLFWDVDRSNLDFDGSATYLIERVAALGQIEDWLIIRATYGMVRLQEVIMGMRYLDDKSLQFYARIFSTPKSDFRCYKLKLLNQPHWPF